MLISLFLKFRKQRRRRRTLSHKRLTSWGRGPSSARPKKLYNISWTKSKPWLVNLKKRELLSGFVWFHLIIWILISTTFSFVILGSGRNRRWSEIESPEWKATLREEVCGGEGTSRGCGGCCEGFTRRVYGMPVCSGVEPLMIIK